VCVCVCACVFVCEYIRIHSYIHATANTLRISYIPNFVMGVIWQPRDVECRASSLEILLKYVPSHVKVDVACMCGCVGACTSAFVLVIAFVFVYVHAGVCVWTTPWQGTWTVRDPQSYFTKSS